VNEKTSFAVDLLLGNDTDPNDVVVTLATVQRLSASGAEIAQQDRDLVYTPPSNFTGEDQFTYTIRNSQGAAATGRVHVLVYDGVLPQRNHLSIVRGYAGYLLRYCGVPGSRCEWQRSTNLTDWAVLSAVTIPSHGVVEFHDAAPPATTAYYRAPGKLLNCPFLSCLLKPSRNSGSR
jgi:hypothetical protein